MIYYQDKKYKFFELFNEKTGTLVRSNVFFDGKQTDIEPVMRAFPELLDIGIMGSCISGKSGICKAAGVDCYQKGAISAHPNMSLDKYQNIISQCKGYVFQVALGGAGDPNKHEEFEAILKVTRDNFIVPNLTTSGHNLRDCEIDLIKRYCGAVAVSFYSTLDAMGQESNPITNDSVRRFVEANCITNIHYTISKKNIKEAIFRIRHNLFPEGVNAVIFLLYKAVGLGKIENVLTYYDSEYTEFFRAISGYRGTIKFGFDSCQSPAIRLYLKQAAPESVEFCEAARFSMYIDSKMIAYPCSFCIDSREYSVDLSQSSICAAWNSSQFSAFKKRQECICSQCSLVHCRNCALNIGINLCGKIRQ